MAKAKATILNTPKRKANSYYLKPVIKRYLFSVIGLLVGKQPFPKKTAKKTNKKINKIYV